MAQAHTWPWLLHGAMLTTTLAQRGPRGLPEPHRSEYRSQDIMTTDGLDSGNRALQNSGQSLS